MPGPYFPSDGRINVDTLSKGMNYFKERGSIKQLIALERYLDHSYLEEALKQLGG